MALTAGQKQRAVASSDAELLQVTLNNVACGVASVRADGSVITSNSVFYDMLRRAGLLKLEFISRKREELVALSLYDISPKLSERPTEVAGLTGCAFELNYIDIHDQLGGTLILMNDVTSRRRNEQAMQAVLTQKETMEQARTTFVSQVAHHFRTPLNVILGYVDILSGNEGVEIDARTRTSYLGFIRESAKALLLNMNEMMEIIRLQRNEQPVELEVRELRTLMTGAIDEIQSVLAAEDVELDAAAMLDVVGTACVRMDARLAKRAIASLLRTSAVLGGAGSHLKLTGRTVVPNGLILFVEFEVGRTDVASILDSIHSGEPVKEISLTGNASGYGLALAAMLLRVCEIDVSATAVGERGVCIEIGFSTSG
ncbi:MAG: histidine kinase dimerization/phospho-acceptor domain-containing protein [Pseudomonadota bacterium]